MHDSAILIFFFSRFKDIATCHEILGVKVDSTKEQIKEAFFEKSKQVQLDQSVVGFDKVNCVLIK